MTAVTRPACRAAVRLGLGGASVVLAILLLVGFQAPHDGVVMGAARLSSGGATGAGGSSAGAAGTSTGTATYDGSVVQTRFGSVQVEITVSGGRVVSVSALALPSGGHSGMISGYAGPILASEALAAQSASIDLVSGATYTSEAYAQSLQAALDQAGV